MDFNSRRASNHASRKEKVKTLPQPISDAERSVSNFKRGQLVKVMAQIIRIAFQKPYFSPADIKEEIVAESDRQGCASNGWSALVAVEIIERLPINFNNAEQKIFAGRIKNTNPGAKGRWTCAYRLLSKKLAETWMRRNGVQLENTDVERFEQMEMV